MNKRNILLASLLLASSLSFGQKLSPSTSLMLQEAASAKKKAKAVDGTEKSVTSFITIKSQDAIEKIEKLGAKVNTRVSETLVTANIPMSAIEPISQLDEVVSVSVGTEAKLLMDNARQLLGVDDCHKMTENNGPYTGKGVVIGIIDNGFQCDHVDFMNADLYDTRIKRIWDQHLTGNAPAGYNYGVEYKSYEEMKAARYDLTSGFHATHVSGIAAGSDKTTPYYGVAPDADLVFVSFLSSNANIVDGIKYVFDYAESVGKPAVVNISLGSHMGPHDGSSDTDLSFAQLVGPGRIIVGAAGNEGLDKLHATKTFTSASKEMKTMFAYDSSQDNSSYKQAYVDIWGDKDSKIAAKAVVVNTINGKIIASSDEVSTGGTTEVKWIAPDGCGVVATVGLSLQVNPNNNRTEVLLLSRATSINTGYAVGVVVTGEAGKTVHMWNNAYGTFTSMNKRGWTDGDTNYTVGELGGESPDVITVGSFNSKSYFQPLSLKGTDNAYQVNSDVVGGFGEHSKFSSYGPTADNRIKPDITAPGCIVVSAGSKYCSGWSDDTNVIARTGSDLYTYDTGTSMASPFVAGSIALWLQANPSLTPEKIRDIFSSTAMQKDKYLNVDGTMTFPNNTWGYGRIDVLNGLKSILGTTGIQDAEVTDAMFRIVTNSQARTATFYIGSDKGQARVAVYNLTGQQVYSASINSNGETISLSSLPHGVYVFKLTQGSNTQTIKSTL